MTIMIQNRLESKCTYLLRGSHPSTNRTDSNEVTHLKKPLINFITNTDGLLPDDFAFRERKPDVAATYTQQKNIYATSYGLSRPSMNNLAVYLPRLNGEVAGSTGDSPLLRVREKESDRLRSATLSERICGRKMKLKIESGKLER